MIQYIPSDVEHFYDVFGGSGTVSMNVLAQTVHLNDYDKLLYGLYDFFLTHSVEDIRRINDELHKEYTDNQPFTRESYEQMRADFNKELANPNIAKLQLLLRYGFLSLLRVNQKGEYNTSFTDTRGRPGTAYYMRIKGFQETLKQRNAVITNKDFREIDYAALTPKDFVYFDPPYLITEAVYNDGWGIEEEQALYEIINELDARGVRFGLSNVLTTKGETNDYLKEFMKDYQCHHLDMTYNTYIGDQENATYKDHKTDEVYVTNVSPYDGGISLF